MRKTQTDSSDKPLSAPAAPGGEAERTPAVLMRGVSKHYSGFTLGPVDLTVPAGEIVGLVGENGAGKTTLLKLLTGVSTADSGTLGLLGGNPTDSACRAQIGVVFEDFFFYEQLSPRQIGISMRGIFGARWDTAAYAELLHRFGLSEGKRLKECSRGMRMKVQLAAALAHHPRLLILDEATSGLDPVMRSELLDLFLEFIQDDSHSVLMSSHITADLAQVADSIAYLHRGQMLFQQNKDTLLAEFGLLRCGEAMLATLPKRFVVATRHGDFGCETLVRGREEVRHLLPQAVCDPAGIDDIMLYYSRRDAE